MPNLPAVFITTPLLDNHPNLPPMTKKQRRRILRKRLNMRVNPAHSRPRKVETVSLTLKPLNLNLAKDRPLKSTFEGTPPKTEKVHPLTERATCLPKWITQTRRCSAALRTGIRRKVGFSLAIGEFFFHRQVMPFKMVLQHCFLAFDRIRICRVDSEGGSWHNKRRGGHQATDGAKASGSCSEGTGGERRKVHSLFVFFCFFYK